MTVDPRVCVLGSINMDLVASVRRLPGPGETVLAEGFAMHPGGKGANQAVSAARMGARVRMIARVGDDDHGRTLVRVLADAGVDTSSVSVTPGVNTGLGLISVARQDGQNQIVVASGANARVSVDDVDADKRAIAEADVLLMQLECPMDATIHAARIASEAGTTVMLNAAPAVGRPPEELLALVDILVANEVEARAIAGSALASAPSREGVIALMRQGRWADESFAATLADQLSSMSCRMAVVTLGALGAAARVERSLVGSPAYRVSPVDTVGAGDAFCGAIATRLAEHQAGGTVDAMTVLDALCWGCAAGALATTRPGAIPSLPTRAEVLALLRSRDLDP